MQINVGTVDRILRIGLSVLITILFLANVVSGTTAIVLSAVAFILLLTGSVGSCPLYSFCRISTKRGG